MTTLRRDAEQIISAAIRDAQPDSAVRRALKGRSFNGRVLLVAIGKAAWQMANAASKMLGDRIEAGIVVTKYGNNLGPIANFEITEAGHPIPDENSVRGAQAAINLVCGLKEEDTVIFLISGGGSALFEKPLIPLEELKEFNDKMLACGADIVEINTLRKRLSAVKGGKFARICKPAQVLSIVLSDIIGDPPDMIASGPAYPDSATTEDALAICKKYNLNLSAKALDLIKTETPKTADNVETRITGSVRQLCASAKKVCAELGYTPFVLTDSLNCEAREAGAFLAAIGRYHKESDISLAFIAGGETVVHLTGQGKGGRNQEIALSAAEGIAGLPDTAVFSVGSDGTDGPTDAAGGYADGTTLFALKSKGISVYDSLRANDSHNALKSAGGLIFTGPTGTNVNDLSVLLIKRNSD